MTERGARKHGFSLLFFAPSIYIYIYIYPSNRVPQRGKKRFPTCTCQIEISFHSKKQIYRPNKPSHNSKTNRPPGGPRKLGGARVSSDVLSVNTSNFQRYPRSHRMIFDLYVKLLFNPFSYDVSYVVLFFFLLQRDEYVSLYTKPNL